MNAATRELFTSFHTRSGECYEALGQEMSLTLMIAFLTVFLRNAAAYRWGTPDRTHTDFDFAGALGFDSRVNRSKHRGYDPRGRTIFEHRRGSNRSSAADLQEP